MRDHVFLPAGMTRTRFYSPVELIPGRSTPYHVDCAGNVTHGPFISDQFSHWGDMGILSTAHDMARWSAAMDSLTLISPTLWAQMWTPVRMNEGWIYPYGFALNVGNANGHAFVFHTGSFRVGYTAMFQRFPDEGLTVTVLTNHWGCQYQAGALDDEAVRTIHPDILLDRLPERPDPQPGVTHSLMLLLQGADAAHGAIPTTPAFRTLVLPDWRHQAPPNELRFVKCMPTPRSNPIALGTPVARECVYRAVRNGENLIFLLTPQDELAGAIRW